MEASRKVALTEGEIKNLRKGDKIRVDNKTVTITTEVGAVDAEMVDRGVLAIGKDADGKDQYITLMGLVRAEAWPDVEAEEGADPKALTESPMFASVKEDANLLEFLGEAKKIVKMASLKSEVSRWFGIEIDEEIEEILQNILTATRKSYAKKGNAFTDLDWGATVVRELKNQGLLEDKGDAQWTQYIKSSLKTAKTAPNKFKVGDKVVFNLKDETRHMRGEGTIKEVDAMSTVFQGQYYLLKIDIIVNNKDYNFDVGDKILLSEDDLVLKDTTDRLQQNKERSDDWSEKTEISKKTDNWSEKDHKAKEDDIDAALAEFMGKTTTVELTPEKGYAEIEKKYWGKGKNKKAMTNEEAKLMRDMMTQDALQMKEQGLQVEEVKLKLTSKYPADFVRMVEHVVNKVFMPGPQFATAGLKVAERTKVKISNLYEIPKELEPLAEYARTFRSSKKFIEAIWKHINYDPETGKWRSEMTLDESENFKDVLPETSVSLVWFEMNFGERDEYGYPAGGGWFDTMAKFWDVANNKMVASLKKKADYGYGPSGAISCDATTLCENFNQENGLCETGCYTTVQRGARCPYNGAWQRCRCGKIPAKKISKQVEAETNNNLLRGFIQKTALKTSDIKWKDAVAWLSENIDVDLLKNFEELLSSLRFTHVIPTIGWGVEEKEGLEKILGEPVWGELIKGKKYFYVSSTMLNPSMSSLETERTFRVMGPKTSSVKKASKPVDDNLLEFMGAGDKHACRMESPVKSDVLYPELPNAGECPCGHHRKMRRKNRPAFSSSAKLQEE